MTLDRANKITPVEYHTYFNTLRTFIDLLESLENEFFYYNFNGIVEPINKLYSALMPKGIVHNVQLRIKEVGTDNTIVLKLFQKLFDEVSGLVKQKCDKTAFLTFQSLEDFIINIPAFAQASENLLSQLTEEDSVPDVESIISDLLTLRSISETFTIDLGKYPDFMLFKVTKDDYNILLRLKTFLNEESLFSLIDSLCSRSEQSKGKIKTLRKAALECSSTLREYIRITEKFSNLSEESNLVNEENYKQYPHYWFDLVLAYNKLISEMPLHLEKLQSLDLISNETAIDYRTKVRGIQYYCYRFTNKDVFTDESEVKFCFDTIINSIVSDDLVSSFISLTQSRVNEKGLSENLEVLTINQYIGLLEDLQVKTKDLLEGKVQDYPLIIEAEVKDSKRASLPLSQDNVNVDRIKDTPETLIPTLNSVYIPTTTETLRDDDSYPFNLITLKYVKVTIERWYSLTQKVSELNLEIKEICEELTNFNLISFEERCNEITRFSLLDESSNVITNKLENRLTGKSLVPLKKVCKTLLPIEDKDDPLGGYFLYIRKLFKSVLFRISDLELKFRAREVIAQITKLQEEVESLLGIGYVRVEESKRKEPFELSVSEYKSSKDNWLDFLYHVTEFLGALFRFFKRLSIFKELWTEEARHYDKQTIDFIFSSNGLCNKSNLKSTTEILDLITLASNRLQEMAEDGGLIEFFDKMRLQLHRKIQNGDCNENAIRKLCVDSISLSIDIVHLNNQITKTLRESKDKFVILKRFAKKPVPSEFKVRTTLENFQRYRLEWITLVQDSRLVFSEMDTTVQFLQNLGIYSKEEASLARVRNKEFMDLCSKFLKQTTCDSYDNTLDTLNSIIVKLTSNDVKKSVLLQFNDIIVTGSGAEKLLDPEMKFIFEYSNLTRTMNTATKVILTGDEKTVNGLVPFQRYLKDSK